MLVQFLNLNPVIRLRVTPHCCWEVWIRYSARTIHRFTRIWESEYKYLFNVYMYSEQFLAGTFHQKQTTFNRWIDNIADCIDRYYLHRIVDYDQICWQQGRRYRIVATLLTCAVIFKQYMGARNQVRIGLSYRPAWLHSLAELDSLESILGLLKS